MSNVDWVLVVTLIIAMLQAVLSVLQARTANRLDKLMDNLHM